MRNTEYLVTARKYRPQRFSDLVAQEHVAQALMNAFKLERIAHAYLFTGPRGVGKTTAARILAKAINCTGHDPGEVEPCLSCESCEDFESQRSLSIFEIDAASNNKVEDIRGLRENIRIPPQGGLRKVYIIDEVHMLSNAAFNALLKTLEEPPSHVLFIFATTEPHKVLPTILSRCQRFDFRRIPTNEIVRHLTKICESEHIQADDDALHLIAQKGDGALRDALSTFDQSVALCGSDLKYSTLADALRVVDVELYFEATQYIADRATGSILSLAERIMSDGYDIVEFLNGLAEHMRNLLITTTLGEHALVDVSKNIRERYVETANEFTKAVLLRLLMVIDEAQSRLPVSSSPRLAVELALVKMTCMSESADLAEALEQIRHLEGQVGQAPPPVPKPPSPASPQVQSPPPSDTPAQKNNPSPSPRAPQSHQTSSSPNSIVLGDKPALSLNEEKPADSQFVEKSSVIPQSPSNSHATPQTSFQESWTLILDMLLTRTDLQGSRTLKDSIPLGVQNQILEVAVRDEVVVRITENSSLKEAIDVAIKSLPDLAVTHMKFVPRPDLFPPMETDWDTKYQELKDKIPALKLIDSAFGLRLVSPTTP